MEKSGQHSNKERNKHKQVSFSVLMQTDNSVNEDVFFSVDADGQLC